MTINSNPPTEMTEGAGGIREDAVVDRIAAITARATPTMRDETLPTITATAATTETMTASGATVQSETTAAGEAMMMTTKATRNRRTTTVGTPGATNMPRTISTVEIASIPKAPSSPRIVALSSRTLALAKGPQTSPSNHRSLAPSGHADHTIAAEATPHQLHSRVVGRDFLCPNSKTCYSI